MVKKGTSPKNKCAKCGSPMHHRSKVCKECGEANPKFVVSTGERTPRRRKRKVTSLEATVEFIREQGGLTKAKESLHAAAGVLAFIDACGGLAEANAALDQVEGVMKLIKG